MTGHVFCFSGKIGSGKSSISAAFARSRNCRLASFGGFVRYMVEQTGGDPTSRQELQDYGQARVDEDVVAFCDDVLRHAGYKACEDLVIDGIRHVDVFDVLRSLLPDCTVSLIHLELDDGIRQSRIEQRGDDRSDFPRAERHLVEKDLQDSLPARADLIIDASIPIDAIVQACLEFASNTRTPDPS